MAPDDQLKHFNKDFQVDGRSALDLPFCQETHDNKQFTLVPLKQWRKNEADGIIVTPVDPTHHHYLKASLLRKVTVAYAISELLRLAAKYETSEQSSLEQLCSMENFVVRVSNVSDIGWEVAGMRILSPPLSLRIDACSFSSDSFFDEGHLELSGRAVSATILGYSESKNRGTFITDDSDLCHCLGVLLHGLFCGEESMTTEVKLSQRENKYEDDYCHECAPVAKKSSLVSDVEFSHNISISRASVIAKESNGKRSVHVNLFPLGELGYPTALSELVKNLVDCGLALFRPDDSYSSLEVTISDLQLLLQYPRRFLFETCDVLSIIRGQRSSMYGRSSEAHKIANAFCRVALTGESEAFLIGGFSGCGKTSLVMSVFESVDAAGGCIVAEKFEEISSRRPLSVVLSAFNDFCVSIVRNNTCEGLMYLCQKILNEFGQNLHFLVSAVPSVQGILSAGAVESSVRNDVDTQVNFHSLCYTVQRFMRIVSCSSRLLLLFLDDLQWADPTSLGLVHSVLSDSKGGSCMFFVGTYRDNELNPDHIVIGFVDMLSKFNIQSTDMHLDGLDEEDVRSIVSEMLGILPRQCQSLADIVCRKTKGNPFFVLEFIRSLVNRGLVQYSLRERRWSWDIVKIGAEDITDNVLHLLGRKLSSLASSEQTALKIASCFGTKMKESFVQHLSESGKLSLTKTALDKLIEDGYMDRDGSHYRFVHDKVREAAYHLISPDCQDQFHFDVGMEMLGKNKEDNDYLLATADQINHGVPSLLTDESNRIAIVELNYEAGLKSLQCSDYSLAHGFMRAAVSLLHDDSWTAHYVFSLKCYLQLAKAAFSCGCNDEAKAALDQIITNGKSLDDKLDAYLLFVSVQYFVRENVQAIKTCIDVIGLLGESIPKGDVDMDLIVSEILETKKMFDREPGDNLLDMAKNVDKRNVSIMKFFGHLVIVAFIAHPKLSVFYCARWARFAVASKVHRKYAGAAFVGFASCLCTEMKNDVMVGHRIGRMGLRCLNQCELPLDELSRIHLLYYPNLGFLFEPLQACLDMHRRGYKSATQVGDTSLAASHFLYCIQREMFIGQSLSSTKAKIEDRLKVSQQYCRLDRILRIYYSAVLVLSGEEVPPKHHQVQSPVLEQLQCINEIMASLYNGHFDRVRFLTRKWESLSAKNNYIMPSQEIYVAFYSGLSVTGSYRAKKSKNKEVLKDINRRLLPILTKAVECSKWNFLCKELLLRAEYLSLISKKNCLEAECVYDEAISAARSSRFVHEEGLACERAGMHYKQNGKIERALAMFRQAKKCFEEWGSPKRVDQLEDLISLLL